MMKRLATLIGLLILPASAFAAPYKSAEFEHQDWVIYCEPRMGCDAISSDLDSNLQYMNMTIRRFWGADDAPRAGFSLGAEADAISVDGKGIKVSVPDQNLELVIENAMLEELEDGRLAMSAEDTARLLPAMLQGSVLQFEVEYEGAVKVGRISLSGISAALRFMDDTQGRAGTTSALVAKGEAIMENPVAPARYLETVSELPATVYNVWSNTPEYCAEVSEAVFSYVAEAYDYPENDRTIWLLPCNGPGAYNTPTAIIITYNDGEVIDNSLSSFAFVTEEGRIATSNIIVNGAFDREASKLTSFARGRGMGDCGTFYTYHWNGYYFALEEGRSKGECDAVFIPVEEWPLVFEATPR